MMFRALVLAALLLAPGELRAEPVPAAAGFEPKLIIYLARGAANSCGPGCDRWIAVEGTVDAGAAARISRFLRGVKDTRRPIYLFPGGSVEPAYAIGRLLRSRKAVARVGRTIVAACAAGTQIDDACLKVKNGGGEVEATISTYHAMCNSACSYLFLGATTRRGLGRGEDADDHDHQQERRAAAQVQGAVLAPTAVYGEPLAVLQGVDRSCARRRGTRTHDAGRGCG